MGWRPLVEAKRSTFGVRRFFSSVLLFFVAWRPPEGTLAGDFVRSHVPTVKAAPLVVTAGSVARRE